MDIFDMGLFGMEDFSFDDMACDILLIGPAREEEDEKVNGEVIRQSMLLSPYGYELTLLNTCSCRQYDRLQDIIDAQKEDDSQKSMPASCGASLSTDLMSDLEHCKVISVCGLFEEDALSTDALLEILKKGKESKALVCLDPGRVIHPQEDRERLRRLAPYIDYILPNTEEAGLLSGQDYPVMMAQSLLDTGIGCVVITMGSQGCFVKGQEAPFAMGALPCGERCAEDMTGMGVNFASGFLYGLFQDWQIKTICEYASGCAAVSSFYPDPVQHAVKRKDEVKKLLKNPYL